MVNLIMRCALVRCSVRIVHAPSEDVFVRVGIAWVTSVTLVLESATSVDAFPFVENVCPGRIIIVDQAALLWHRLLQAVPLSRTYQGMGTLLAST